MCSRLSNCSLALRPCADPCADLPSVGETREACLPSGEEMERGSTLIAFSVDGGKAGAFAAANALKLVKLSNNLGDAKSLLTHPATTTHKNLAPEAREVLGIDHWPFRTEEQVQAQVDAANVRQKQHVESAILWALQLATTASSDDGTCFQVALLFPGGALEPRSLLSEAGVLPRARR